MSEQIPLENLTLLPLREVPRVLARWGLKRKNGKPIHSSTAYRWASRGINGHRLVTTQVGRTRVTSTDDLIRFFESTGRTNVSAIATPRQHARVMKRSNREAREILGLTTEEMRPTK